MIERIENPPRSRPSSCLFYRVSSCVRQTLMNFVYVRRILLLSSPTQKKKLTFLISSTGKVKLYRNITFVQFKGGEDRGGMCPCDACFSFVLFWLWETARPSSMSYSLQCPDEKTRWDDERRLCVPCSLKPGTCPQFYFNSVMDSHNMCIGLTFTAATGREITPNCGFDDHGGRHEVPHKPCKSNTYNEGSEPYCKPCSQCEPGYRLVSPCNSTRDSLCEVDKVDLREWVWLKR